MPLQVGSRYSFCLALTDAEGQMFLTERDPYTYVDLPDTRTHAAVSSDTLFSLAAKYFAPLPRACGFWWVIADFQPDPIVDPTLTLDVGRLVYIPSNRVLTDVILGQARRRRS
jgi:hypothetical protein